MVSRAKLTLAPEDGTAGFDQVEAEEKQVPRKKVERKAVKKSAAVTVSRPPCRERGSLARAMFFVGLTFASLVVFKRKIF